MHAGRRRDQRDIRPSLPRIFQVVHGFDTELALHLASAVSLDVKSQNLSSVQCNQIPDMAFPNGTTANDQKAQ
jgi:hypothetical protein